MSNDIIPFNLFFYFLLSLLLSIPVLLVPAAGPSSLSGGSVGGVASMSGVIYSDDDSDLSVSDIDEGVIARE